MTTRKIVPRADNEGALGTALKRWASAFINALTADSATIGTLSGIVKAAAGVLSALALGAADLKLFMDAAGTGLEWAKGFKMGTFTRAPGSGDISYTGVGFKPSVIIFLMGIAAGNIMSSIGFDNGTSPYCLANYHNVTAEQWIASLKAIYSLESGSNTTEAFVKSLDSDGFTLTWTAYGSPTTTMAVYYLALR